MRATMSQHSQRTQMGPSVISIVVGVVLTLTASTTVAWILHGTLGGRDIAGALLGTALALILAEKTVTRHADRVVARDRVRRAAERAERAAQRAATPRRQADPDPVATQPVDPDHVDLEDWAGGGTGDPMSGVEPSDTVVVGPDPLGGGYRVGTLRSDALLIPVDRPRFKTETQRTNWMNEITSVRNLAGSEPGFEWIGHDHRPSSGQVPERRDDPVVVPGEAGLADRETQTFPRVES